MVAYPRNSSSSSTAIWDILVFEEMEKLEYLEKNLSARGKEKNQQQPQRMFGDPHITKANSTHVW